MSKFGKVVIAHSVLAGLAITDRLVELEVPFDEQLTLGVVSLAEGLASVMTAVEILDKGVAAITRLVEKGDIAQALVGLHLIKEATSQMVSEQEALDAAMGVDPMEREIKNMLETLLAN
jgi:hypothetical protein